MENEYLVQSIRQDTSLVYIVNNVIGMYTCPIDMSDAPCKHQEAVVIKFHIASFNFLPSLILEDRMLYAYITLDKITFMIYFLLT